MPRAQPSDTPNPRTPPVLHERVDHVIEDLRVVNRRVRHGVFANELILLVSVDVVLVAVIRLTALLGPTCIEVFLRDLVSLSVPLGRHLTLVDKVIFFSRIPLARGFDDGCVDDLTALGTQAFLAQVALEPEKEIALEIRTLYLLAELPDRLGIR